MDRRELGIYVHIPFCAAKCRYCDFLSFPAARQVQEDYFRALLEEIRAFDRADDYEAVSVYFGGGTPSVPDKERITETLELIFSVFRVREDAEITIECNPGTLDEGRLEAYKNAGFNRLSLGLQSADNGLLKTLGRIHTFETFREEFLAARRAGFSNISVDLMYSLPGQTLGLWEDTLKKVLALSPEHISAYSLIVEEGTPFWDLYHEDAAAKERGDRPLFLPDEDTEDQMLDALKNMLRKIGMYRYEISNYSRQGYESRHNTGYWLRREYAGFGLGASGQLGRERLKNTEDLGVYLGRYLKSIPSDGTKSDLSDGAKSDPSVWMKSELSVGTKSAPSDGTKSDLSVGKKNGPSPEMTENGARKRCAEYNEEKSTEISCIKKEITGQAISERVVLDEEEEMAETMILGLRMVRGVDLAAFEKKFGVRAQDRYSDVIEEFLQKGLLEQTDTHLRLTDRGFDVSNLVMCSFL